MGIGNHTKIGKLRQIVTDRIYLHLLPVTERAEMADALDDAARQQWSEGAAAIPYAEGDLQAILTDVKHSHRVVKVSSNRLVIAIKHNGYAFNNGVRARVDALLNTKRLVKDATDALRRKHSGRRGRRGRGRR